MRFGVAQRSQSRISYREADIQVWLEVFVFAILFGEADVQLWLQLCFLEPSNA